MRRTEKKRRESVIEHTLSSVRKNEDKSHGTKLSLLSARLYAKRFLKGTCINMHERSFDLGLEFSEWPRQGRSTRAEIDQALAMYCIKFNN